MQKRGLSLLEAAFAGFLFSTVMVGMFGLWPMYARAAAKNRQYLGAAFLARQELAWAQSQPFATLAGRTRNLSLSATIAGRQSQVDYRCQMTVDAVNPDLKSLKVSVT